MNLTSTNAKRQLPSKNKSKCPVSKLKFFILSVLLFLVGYFYYYQSSPPLFSFSDKAQCAFKDKVYKNEVKFSPEEYDSLDVTVSGYGKGIDFKFLETTDKTINIVSALKLTNNDLNHKVVTTTGDGTYFWKFEAPEFIKEHGECATGSITVEIPKGLSNYGSIRVILPDAKIDSTHKSKLLLNYFHVSLHSGAIIVSEKSINKFVSSVHSGSISVRGINSTYTYLASSLGDLVIADSAIQQVHANSIDGSVEVEVRGTEYVTSNTVNGHVSIKVQSVEHGKENQLNAIGRTSNGDVTIDVPKSFRGDFIVYSFNGLAQTSFPLGQKVKFAKNYTHFKAGNVGDKVELGRLSSKTFNGLSQINIA